MLEFRVLGPLEVLRDGRAVAVGARKQRALLAVLLMARGRVVSLDRLIDELWGEEPPAQATGALQVYISNLRRLLEPDRPRGARSRVLVSRPPGYALVVEAGAHDAARFEEAVSAGRAAVTQGRPSVGEEMLTAALALWRGAALSEFASEDFARGEAARLEELRMAAVEARLEAALALGEHRAVVAELQALVAEHRLREGLWSALVLALYRCGRQGDALAACAQARRVLVEELGVEPGPGLRRLEAAVLAQDSDLDWRSVGRQRPDPVAVAAAPASEPVAATSSLVGREGPLRVIDEAQRRAFHVRSAVVVVSGEAGIGKTRLAEEVAFRAGDAGAMVAWGRCHDGDGAPPLWPWIQILRHLVSVMDPAVVAEALGSAVGDIAQIVPEVNDVVDHFEPPPALDPVAARFRLAEAVGGFVSRLSATAPMVVILDDVHRADAATLDLLTFLAAHHERARVLVVVAYRHHEVPATSVLAAALGALARRPDLVRIELTGLSARDVGLHIAQVAGEEAAPEVAESVWARTEGNPFLVGELARLLASKGALKSAPGSWPQIPAGARDVLLQRLGRLPATTIASLEVAAVMGRDFDLRSLAAVKAQDIEAVAERLEAAVLTGLLTEDAGSVGVYRFAHALVQEALYGELTAVRRSRLHGRVGEAIEASPDAAGRLEELAHHFFQAAPVSGPERGIAYAFQAADAARQLAYETSERHLRRAVELAGTLPAGPERLRVELEARVALATLLTFVRGFTSPVAGEAWADSARLAEQTGDFRTLVDASWGLYGAVMCRGDFTSAIELAAQIHGAATVMGNNESVIGAEACTGMVRLCRGELGLAADRLGAGCRASEGVVDESLVIGMTATICPRAMCRYALGIVSWLLGDKGAGRELTESGMALARENGHPVAIGCALWFTCLLEMFRDDAAAAANLAEELCDLSGRHGLADLALLGQAGRGWVATYGDDPEGGLADMEAAVSTMRARNYNNLQAIIVGKIGEFHLRSGRSSDAVHAVDEALRIVDAIGERLFEAELYRIRGEALARLGPEHAALARDALVRAVTVAGEQGAVPFRLRAEASLQVIAPA